MGKSYHRGHIEIPNHSPQQATMFFAVSSALGFKAIQVKERAKIHFKLGCFNQLTVSNMIFLIDKLVQRQLKEDEKEA